MTDGQSSEDRLVLFGICCKVWPLDAAYWSYKKSRCQLCGNVPKIYGNNLTTSRSQVEREWGLSVTLENDPDDHRV